MRTLALQKPPHPISVDDDVTAQADQLLIDHFHRTRKPKAFWKAMEKIRFK